MSCSQNYFSVSAQRFSFSFFPDLFYSASKTFQADPLVRRCGEREQELVPIHLPYSIAFINFERMSCQIKEGLWTQSGLQLSVFLFFFFSTNCLLLPNRWISPSDICLKCQFTSPRLCPSLIFFYLQSLTSCPIQSLVHNIFHSIAFSVLH